MLFITIGDMKIIFNDNTEKSLIMVTGESMFVQGANRDTLTFVFDDTNTLDGLDELFTEERCEKFILVEDEQIDEIGTRVGGNYYVHSNYTVRVGIEKVAEKTDEKTDDGADVYVNRIKVKMAQRTYGENQLKILQEELINTQIALLDLYEGGLE